MPGETNTQRCEAVLHISEAVSACRTPEDLVRVLVEQVGEFLPCDQLDVVVCTHASKGSKR
jgi:hypothetical protein